MTVTWIYINKIFFNIHTSHFSALYFMPIFRAHIQHRLIQISRPPLNKPFESQMYYPTESSTAVCKAEVEASTFTPVWWWDCCKLLMTLPRMTFFNRFPVEWHLYLHPPHHQPSIHHLTPTRTLIPPSIRVTIAQQRLLPPAFTWSTPLSRCWIWSNHSQSSLNISFFKQKRGSKFHHSMTRSVADNTIKPIPAYPGGAISGGTAGRWDYRPTERCQSPLIHSSLCEPSILRISNSHNALHFLKGSNPLSDNTVKTLALAHAFVLIVRHAHKKNHVNTIAQFFSGHLKAALLEMLPGHWANKGQGGYEIVCLTGPFPLCAPAAAQPYPHS